LAHFKPTTSSQSAADWVFPGDRQSVGNTAVLRRLKQCTCYLLISRLKIRLLPRSQSFSTIYPELGPGRKHFTEVAKQPALAHSGSKRTAHLRHSPLGVQERVL